jgi:hypothetical protein
MLYVRCLAMGFLLSKARPHANRRSPDCPPKGTPLHSRRKVGTFSPVTAWGRLATTRKARAFDLPLRYVIPTSPWGIPSDFVLSFHLVLARLHLRQTELGAIASNHSVATNEA